MGMTIDKAEEWLKLAVPIKALTQEEFETFIQAVNLAMDTMEKYQKIEELYDYWRSGKCEYTISCMENIGKVLKDGNDD